MFSIKEVVGYGFKMAQKNYAVLFGGLIMFGVFKGMDYFLGNTTLDDASLVLTVLFFLCALILQIMQYEMMMGQARVCLKICDGHKSVIADYLSCFPLMFIYIGATIIWTIIVSGVPGLLAYFTYNTQMPMLLKYLLYAVEILLFICLAIKTMFSTYLIVDKNKGPISSMTESFLLTRGREWQLILLCTVLFLINILGAACLLVGLLITIPATSVSIAYVYRKISAA
jgi:uncharacterized membrane protein